MIEQWKDIEGYSRYKVSDMGNVYDKKTDRIVSQVLSGEPQYYYVNLNRDDGYRKLERVHRLVAKAFIPNPYELPIVDHRDRDKLNNKLENLRWTDSSGNQRNKESNLFVGDVYLKDFVLRYENPCAAYTYIASRLAEGKTEDQAVAEYQVNLDFGLKRQQVMWRGETRYLLDICNQYGKDYSVIADMLYKGVNIWNAIFDVPETNPYSFEIKNGSVCVWYPSKNILAEEMGISVDVLRTRLEMFDDLYNLKRFDPKDSIRQTVLGVFGTIPEICKYFGVEESMVGTRMRVYGMTLEEALSVSKKKIKVVYFNGERITPKALYEKFGLNAKVVNRKKSKDKLTIHEVLELFGVDTSPFTLTY